MKPRRILYVTRIVRGGMAVVVDQLAKGLDKDRYTPIVLCDTNIQSNFRDGLASSGIKIIDLTKVNEKQATAPPNMKNSRDFAGKAEAYFGKGAGQFYLALKDFRNFLLHQAPRIRLFLNAIRENGIDLVHTQHDLSSGKPEIIAAKIAGVPCISHRHGYSNYSYFDKFFSRFVATFIYISKDVANHHQLQGEPESKGIIIHNGIDIKEFSRNDAVQIKKEFNCRPDDSLIGIVGRIDWWKGQEYFLEAIAEVLKQKTNVKGLIIGGLKNRNKPDRMEYLNKLKLLVRTLGIEEKIIFTGFRDDVPRLISGLDVVVHASCTPEPFGLVVIEGMAAGKPVVATAAGGVLDIIEDGVNGLLVPCKDSKAMAEAILQILSDRDKAKRMGLAARRRVTEKFTVQHQVTAVQKIYDSILVVA